MNERLFVVKRNGVPDVRVPVSPGRVRVGRAGSSDLYIPDPSVDEHHLEIRVQDDRVEILPLTAHRVTTINGEPVESRRAWSVHPGDRIGLGSRGVEILYEQVGQERVPQPDATPAAAPAYRPEPPLPDGPSRYLRYLPDPYQDSEFLGNFLRIFEAIWEPLEHRQNQLPLYFQAATAPDALVPWLLSWVGLSLGADWPMDRQCAVLGRLADLVAGTPLANDGPRGNPTRLPDGARLGGMGTRAGLELLLALATGGQVEVSEPPDQPFVLHVRVALPARSPLASAEVRRVVEMAKPAHVAYRLEVSVSG